MSKDLYWIPITEERNRLPRDLRDIVNRRFSLPTKFVKAHHWGYFEGLVDAGVGGAQDVLDAFVKHEQIQLYAE